MPLLLWLHAGAAYTLAFLLIPPREILTRWRRTIPYLGVYLLDVLFLWWGLEAPPVLAVLLGALLLVGGFYVAALVVIRYRCADAWTVRDGIDAAVVLLEHRRGRRRRILSGPRDQDDRWVLHSWASWRHTRGLGAVVADAALAQAPRPLWLQAATPELARLYARLGAQHTHQGSWMLLP